MVSDYRLSGRLFALFHRGKNLNGLPLWRLHDQRQLEPGLYVERVLIDGATAAVQIHNFNQGGGRFVRMYGLTPLGTLGPLGDIRWPAAAPGSGTPNLQALEDGVVVAANDDRIVVATRALDGWTVTEDINTDVFAPDTPGLKVCGLRNGTMLVAFDKTIDFQPALGIRTLRRDVAGRWTIVDALPDSSGIIYDLELLASDAMLVPEDQFQSEFAVWTFSPSGWVRSGLVPAPWDALRFGGVRSDQFLVSVQSFSSTVGDAFARFAKTASGFEKVRADSIGDVPEALLNAAVDHQTVAFFTPNADGSIAFTAYDYNDPIATDQLPEFIPEEQTGIPGLTFITYAAPAPSPARYSWRFRGQPITGPALPPPLGHVAATPSFGPTSLSLSLQTSGTAIDASDITLAVLDDCGVSTIELPCARPEFEPNDFLSAPVLDIAPGQSVVGISYGSTADGSFFSRDYLGLRAAPPSASAFLPGAPMITRHRFSVRAMQPNLTGLPQFSVDLRGHPVSGGVVNTSVATPLQLDSETDPIVRTVQWYALGSEPTRMDVRVAARPESAQGQYLGTLRSEPVIPATISGLLTSGPVTFTTNFNDQFTDTELWLFDANLRPIPGAGNDDTPIEPGLAFAGATLSTVLEPGRYYLALSLYDLTTELPTPLTDGSPGGSVTANPGVVVSSSTLTQTDVTLRIDHQGVPVVNAPGQTTAPPHINIPARIIGPYDVQWIALDVGEFPRCGSSDVASPGQRAWPDAQLTADDIIVFVGWFFADDVRADVASPGQAPGADGQFTADDIILFVNRFFAGC
jgi:hypothetical protein